jgi:hypothetical protein
LQIFGPDSGDILGNGSPCRPLYRCPDGYPGRVPDRWADGSTGRQPGRHRCSYPCRSRCRSGNRWPNPFPGRRLVRYRHCSPDGSPCGSECPLRFGCPDHLPSRSRDGPRPVGLRRSTPRQPGSDRWPLPERSPAHFSKPAFRERPPTEAGGSLRLPASDTILPKPDPGSAGSALPISSLLPLSAGRSYPIPGWTPAAQCPQHSRESGEVMEEDALRYATRHTLHAERRTLHARLRQAASGSGAAA